MSAKEDADPLIIMQPWPEGMFQKRLHSSKDMVKKASELNKKMDGLCRELSGMATNRVLGKGERTMREEARDG